jgi:hypothetical protein
MKSLVYPRINLSITFPKIPACKSVKEYLSAFIEFGSRYKATAYRKKRNPETVARAIIRNEAGDEENEPKKSPWLW